MNKVGILATLQAHPGREADVEQFLIAADPLVATGVGTTGSPQTQVEQRSEARASRLIVQSFNVSTEDDNPRGLSCRCEGLAA